MIKKLSSIIFALALLINNVLAIEADIFVQSTVNRAAKTLRGNLTKDERIEKLKEIASDTVDWTKISGSIEYTFTIFEKKIIKNEIIVKIFLDNIDYFYINFLNVFIIILYLFLPSHLHTKLQ